MPKELRITKENAPAAGAARMERADLDREALACAAKASVASVVCVETHKEEQTFPWVIGSVIAPLHDSAGQGPAYDPLKDTIRFERVRAAEPVLTVRLFEALQPGSTTYTVSTVEVQVAARPVRVIDVQMEQVRSGGHRAAADANNQVTPPSRQRVRIGDTSLHAIRAEMPTQSDDWEVESVAEYRMQYGVEQWLVQWKGWGEERNTWEPWEHLLTPEVQGEAKQVKEASLPCDAAGLGKLTVGRLRDALSTRGQDTSGLKAVLIERLCAYLVQEA